MINPIKTGNRAKWRTGGGKAVSIIISIIIIIQPCFGWIDLTLGCNNNNNNTTTSILLTLYQRLDFLVS